MPWVDESATGSVNFYWSSSSGSIRLRRIGPVHLRAPSVSRGFQSFLWAILFFVVIYLGMVAVDVSKATSLIVALVSSFLIFILVRTRGDHPPLR